MPETSNILRLHPIDSVLVAITGLPEESRIAEENIIFRRMLDVASGRRTKSESLGIGNDEFVPWQIGAVM